MTWFLNGYINYCAFSNGLSDLMGGIIELENIDEISFMLRRWSVWWWRICMLRNQLIFMNFTQTIFCFIYVWLRLVMVKEYLAGGWWGGRCRGRGDIWVVFLGEVRDGDEERDDLGPVFLCLFLVGVVVSWCVKAFGRGALPVVLSVFVRTVDFYSMAVPGLSQCNLQCRCFVRLTFQVQNNSVCTQERRNHWFCMG